MVDRIAAQRHAFDGEHREFRHCVFGRWYLSPTSRELGHLPGLVEMGIAHREMHASASVMLAATLETGAVPEPEYDVFMNRVIRLGGHNRVAVAESPTAPASSGLRSDAPSGEDAAAASTLPPSG